MPEQIPNPLGTKAKVFAYLSEGIGLNRNRIESLEEVDLVSQTKYDSRYKVRDEEMIYTFTEKKTESDTIQYRVSALSTNKLENFDRPNKTTITIEVVPELSAESRLLDLSKVTVTLEYGEFIKGTRVYPYKFIFDNAGKPQTNIKFKEGTLRQDEFRTDIGLEGKLAKLPFHVSILNIEEGVTFIDRAFFIIKRMSETYDWE